MATNRMEAKVQTNAQWEEVRSTNRMGRLKRERVAGTNETRLVYETAPERIVLLVARDVDTPFDRAFEALKRKEKEIFKLIYEPEKFQLREIAVMLTMEPHAVLNLERAMARHLQALLNPVPK